MYVTSDIHLSQLLREVVVVRETQVFDLCSDQEAVDWHSTVSPAHSHWLDRLEQDPSVTGTGCLSVRRLREGPRLDEPQGDLNRRTQIAYFLSLEHAEKAARREPTHRVMREAYRRVYETSKENGAIHVAPPPVELWAGVYILEQDKCDCLYVK